MTPAEFTGQWKRSPLIQFKLASSSANGLSEASATALREYGLPETADPWLSFMELAAHDNASASESEQRGLFPVGMLANGSLICIEKATDRLVIFDREDPEELWALNSSLEALYESMLLFDRFIAEVNRRNPAYSSDFRIPDGMLRELEERLTACDPDAMSSGGFWHCELQALDDSTL